MFKQSYQLCLVFLLFVCFYQSVKGNYGKRSKYQKHKGTIPYYSNRYHHARRQTALSRTGKSDSSPFQIILRAINRRPGPQINGRGKKSVTRTLGMLQSVLSQRRGLYNHRSQKSQNVFGVLQNLLKNVRMFKRNIGRLYVSDIVRRRIPTVNAQATARVNVQATAGVNSLTTAVNTDSQTRTLNTLRATGWFKEVSENRLIMQQVLRASLNGVIAGWIETLARRDLMEEFIDYPQAFAIITNTVLSSSQKQLILDLGGNDQLQELLENVPAFTLILNYVQTQDRVQMIVTISETGNMDKLISNLGVLNRFLSNAITPGQTAAIRNLAENGQLEQFIDNQRG
ncbi:mytilin-2 [Mytilus californianus]|uniref:Mytilin-2 n=1 Tax=Mytilus californianus TaxID=6549 RepID=MYT2_MYTCA|nr:mytilin-2 [Mytilus californianus]P86858.1 RecName: Full=Mytilin-2; AltName: Full=Mytilus uncharacterized protein 2; Short=MUSP-2; Flags: Precursor [Mytilus californianus]